MIKYLVIYNIIVFIIYGIDKYKAIKHKYRISEKTLILFAFFFGIIGAISSMIIFNHKTNSTKFKIYILLAGLFNFILFTTIIYML